MLDHARRRTLRSRRLSRSQFHRRSCTPELRRASRVRRSLFRDRRIRVEECVALAKKKPRASGAGLFDYSAAVPAAAFAAGFFRLPRFAAGVEAAAGAASFFRAAAFFAAGRLRPLFAGAAGNASAFSIIATASASSGAFAVLVGAADGA